MGAACADTAIKARSANMLMIADTIGSPKHLPPHKLTMADNRDKLQDFIDAFTSEIKLLDASGT